MALLLQAVMFVVTVLHQQEASTVHTSLRVSKAPSHCSR